MPFASYATSGFQIPSGPDWTQFALQANQLISHGTDLMAQQSQNLVESIDKTTQQVGRLMKENSPEGKLMKELKIEALKAQKSMFAEYKAMSPAQRAATFEFKNGMLQYKDKYKGMQAGMNLYNASLRSKVLEAKLRGTPGNAMDEWQRSHSRTADVTGGDSDAGAPVLTGGTGETVTVGDIEAADDTGEAGTGSESDTTDYGNEDTSSDEGIG